MCIIMYIYIHTDRRYLVYRPVCTKRGNKGREKKTKTERERERETERNRGKEIQSRGERERRRRGEILWWPLLAPVWWGHLKCDDNFQ